VNGSHDVIIYTVNSFILQQHLPNAQLIIYPIRRTGRSTSIRSYSPARLDVPRPETMA